jgi:hypothetical protein
LQGAPRLPLLGKVSGAPNASADAQCSYGGLDAQMLLRSATLTSAFGMAGAATWSAQPYTHRVYVRETAPAPITIVSVGTGRRWSDGLIARSCADYRNATTGGRSYAGLTGTGTYTVKPDPAQPEFDVLCEMDTDGGGWTLALRTVWDWTATSALLTGFDDFYSKFVGGPGAAWRLPASVWPGLFSAGQLLTVVYPRNSSGGSDCSPLFHKASGGTIAVNSSAKSLTITGMTASAPILNGATALSTTDSGPSAACVSSLSAVPWIYSNCCETCLSLKGSYWSEPRPSVNWIGVKPDLNGKVVTDACSGGTAEYSKGFYGVNRIELYFR